MTGIFNLAFAVRLAPLVCSVVKFFFGAGPTG